MSGLLEKDICLLLKGHRNTMILFLMICVFLGLSQTVLSGYRADILCRASHTAPRLP